MKERENKASENVRNLQGTFDNELQIAKVVPPSGQSKNAKVHLNNVNASNKWSKIETDPAILVCHILIKHLLN